jgi:hypothetical protein
MSLRMKAAPTRCAAVQATAGDGLRPPERTCVRLHFQPRLTLLRQGLVGARRCVDCPAWAVHVNTLSSTRPLPPGTCLALVQCLSGVLVCRAGHATDHSGAGGAHISPLYRRIPSFDPTPRHRMATRQTTHVRRGCQGLWAVGTCGAGLSTLTGAPNRNPSPFTAAALTSMPSGSCTCRQS